MRQIKAGFGLVCLLLVGLRNVAAAKTNENRTKDMSKDSLHDHMKLRIQQLTTRIEEA